jgi:hypothetical protein
VDAAFVVAGAAMDGGTGGPSRRGAGTGLADVVPVVAPRFGRELEAGVDAELLVHVAEVAADGERGDVAGSCRGACSAERA